MALFYAAIAARDAGKKQVELAAIKRLFIEAAGIESESPQSRAAEFGRTVQSAYSRPARRANREDCLPDATRQALLQRGMSTTARLLDMAYSYGLAGETLSLPALIQTGKLEGVSRYAILAALESGFFGVSRNPPPPPKHAKDSVTKSNLIQRGRRPLYVSIPTRIEISRAVGVPIRWATFASGLFALSPARKALTARLYRVRALATLINRRAGQYSQQALAHFVGLKSRRTVIRYLKHELYPFVAVTPMIERQQVNGSNLDMLGNLEGRYLEALGRKFRPTAEKAAALLGEYGERLTLWLCRVRPSYYSTRTAEAREIAACSALGSALAVLA